MKGVGDGFSLMDGEGFPVDCDATLLPRVWGLLEGSLFLIFKVMRPASTPMLADPRRLRLIKAKLVLKLLGVKTFLGLRQRRNCTQSEGLAS